jgi:hypothetical protein
LVFSKYEEEKEAREGKVEAETSFPTLVEWVWNVVQEHQHLGMALEDPEIDVLSCPPTRKTLRYQRLKAYGNHFQVSDCNTKGMVSFDCGVASIFGQWQALMGDEHASIHYVGVLKDIL